MLSDRLHLRDIRNTSTFRLTVLLGLVFAVGVVALLGLIYGLSARELTVRSDHILRLEAASFATVPAARLPERIRIEIAHNSSRVSYFGLQTAAGRAIAGNIALTGPIRPGKPFNIDAAPPAHGPLRILVVSAAGGTMLLIGRDITPILDLRHRVLIVLLASGLAIAVMVLAAGVALSLAPLRRVRDLQRASRDIAAGHLHVRMPLSGRGDELDLFAATVNAMVEEVARVVAQVKEVTDAVAHDLRTPLTRVRAQLHRLHALPGLDPRAAAMAQAATGDLDIVLERFAALLRIAELEAADRRAAFTTVAIGSLIAEVCDLYDPLAEDRGIALASAGAPDIVIDGDRQLLFEALGNLVDNAIKFTPPGGHVAVTAHRHDGAVSIEVRDDGPGLPPVDRKAVLRRFHRGTDTADIPGSGLGLSIVAAIVHLHGFLLELDDAAPGLVVRIRGAERAE